MIASYRVAVKYILHVIHTPLIARCCCPFSVVDTLEPLLLEAITTIWGMYQECDQGFEDRLYLRHPICNPVLCQSDWGEGEDHDTQAFWQPWLFSAKRMNQRTKGYISYSWTNR